MALAHIMLPSMKIKGDLKADLREIVKKIRGDLKEIIIVISH
jgi:hypothetical protein